MSANKFITLAKTGASAHINLLNLFYEYMPSKPEYKRSYEPEIQAIVQNKPEYKQSYKPVYKPSHEPEYKSSYAPKYYDQAT